ncbi:MAG: nucleoside monophosphate kinase [Puniceicoccales bacterium]|jgi:adenylate kinase|nr:nucleoside monophosphate kinase [Puniceicoccales bacterium]
MFTHEEPGDAMKIKDEERAREVFDDVWETLSKKGKFKRRKFPMMMVWLNGAPGSGKGTNCASVMRVLEISSKPIEVSFLLNNPEDQVIKAAGGLIDDRRVVFLVFKELLRREYAKGVVIDGFPRTPVQAICLKLLMERIRANDHNRSPFFKIINFTVSRETSVARQLKRGRDAMEYNKLTETVAIDGIGPEAKIPVRETDLFESKAALRYQTYEENMKNCVAILRDMPEYYEINTEGDMEAVRNKVYRLLSL